MRMPKFLLMCLVPTDITVPVNSALSPFSINSRTVREDVHPWPAKTLFMIFHTMLITTLININPKFQNSKLGFRKLSSRDTQVRIPPRGSGFESQQSTRRQASPQNLKTNVSVGGKFWLRHGLPGINSLKKPRLGLQFRRKSAEASAEVYMLGVPEYFWLQHLVKAKIILYQDCSQIRLDETKLCLSENSCLNNFIFCLKVANHGETWERRPHNTGGKAAVSYLPWRVCRRFPSSVHPSVRPSVRPSLCRIIRSFELYFLHPSSCRLCFCTSSPRCLPSVVRPSLCISKHVLLTCWTVRNFFFLFWIFGIECSVQATDQPPIFGRDFFGRHSLCVRKSKLSFRIFGNVLFHFWHVFPFCISFYNTRFGNWLNISDKRQLIEAIVDAQAKATDCPEYATYCHAYLDQNKFPPQVLDHWFFGCRLHDKDFNKEFIKEGIRMLKESMKNHSKMSTGGLELDWQKKFPALLAPAKEWNTTDEESNSADTEKEDVLQHFSMIKKEMSFSFHALTNQMAFDNQKRQRKGIFSLVPIAVQPINTRGVRLEWATKGKNWDGTKEYRAFEYITQHPATARVLNKSYQRHWIEEASATQPKSCQK